MTTYLIAALVAVSIWLFAGPQVLALAEKYGGRLDLNRRHVAAAGLLAAAALLWSSQRAAPQPTPSPEATGLVLHWVGPTAAEDAAKVAALYGEVADELEWDWSQPEPPGSFLKTGESMDDLRSRAFRARLKGQSIGERQPQAVAAIRSYLDAKAGTWGGPLSTEQKAAWVAAYREVSRSAEASVR